MKKRIIALFVAALLVIFAAGCGGAKEETEKVLTPVSQEKSDNAGNSDEVSASSEESESQDKSSSSEHGADGNNASSDGSSGSGENGTSSGNSAEAAEGSSKTENAGQDAASEGGVEAVYGEPPADVDVSPETHDASQNEEYYDDSSDDYYEGSQDSGAYDPFAPGNAIGKVID